MCGLGPEMRTVDGDLGFHGMQTFYLPALLDQFPPTDQSPYPAPPPQLPTVKFFTTSFVILVEIRILIGFRSMLVISLLLNGDEMWNQRCLVVRFLLYLLNEAFRSY